MTITSRAPRRVLSLARGMPPGRRATLVVAFCVITGLVQSTAGKSALASSAPTETFITWFSDYGEWVGRGQNYLFYPGNASIHIAGTAEYGGAYLDDSQDRTYNFTFSAPPGGVLQQAEYDGAQMASVFQDPGRPGIDISGYARGCEGTGRFRVNSITTGLNSSIKRLWLVYEQRCRGDVLASYGEVRLNTPSDGGRVIVGPHHVRWPKTDPQHPMKVIPVYVVNPGDTETTMQTARISGPDVQEFRITRDECAGIRLGANAVCRVFVEFAPGTPGEKQATLTIPETGGANHATLLEGYVYSGTTRVTLHSEPGDFIGQGQDYEYTPANSDLWMIGNDRYVRVRLWGYNGDWWDSEFAPPAGERLTPGSTFTATDYPVDGSGAGMTFRGNERGCHDVVGKFTVTDISLNRWGEVERFGVDFEQHCSTDWATPPLYGKIRVRADSQTQTTAHSVAVTSSKGGRVISDVAGIDCGADCTETYPYGTTVTMTAAPDSGYTFTGWLGSCAGIHPCALKTTENRRLQAMFSATATTTTITSVKRSNRVIARGTVSPVHAGKSVKVRLKVLRTGLRPATVATKTATLNSEGHYSVRFSRSNQRRCEMTTVFPGDADHDASSASIAFGC